MSTVEPIGIRSEPWKDDAPTIAGVPTMVSRAEQRYLHWLARTQWTDAGHIVEIGPWLGGSTLCLAQGMEASGRDGRHRLHAFDNFVWRGFMERYAPLALEPGTSFENVFLRNLGAHRGRIESHAATLPDEKIPGDAEAEGVRGVAPPELPAFAWDAREPIEILFVDGAKSWRGMLWLLSHVAPALVPGRTLLVCQDFKHWGSYWVPLVIARIRQRLELVHLVRRGSTATFRLVAPLDAREFEELPDDATRLPTEAALADIDAMARWIDDSGDALGATHVRLAGAQLLLHHGRPADALARFERVQARWPIRGGKGQLNDARRVLTARGLAPSPWSVWRRLSRALVPDAGGH